MSEEGKETKLGSVQEVHANGSAESVETECLLGDQAECTNKPEIQSAVGLAVDISQSKNVDTEFRSLAFGSATSIRSTGHRHMVNARTVLWYLSFFGFAINYMLRMNINIAITEMITTNASDKTSAPSECIVDRFANGTTKIDLGNVSNSMIKAISAPSPSYTTEQRMLDYFGLNFSPAGNHWNEAQTNQVLGAYYWIHWTSQILGGVLAKRYGTKLVFGGANLVVSLLSLAVPIAAYWNLNALIALRILQGWIAGLQWPSMHNLAAHWIPPDERSRFVTSYLGSSVGLAIFSPLFGYIIGTWSWQWVFYVSGIVGSVWYIGWVIFVFDTPAQHPRIHPLERQYIEKSLEGIVHNDRKGSVPWKSIFLSPPLWANLFAQWGCVWAVITLMTQTPSYFRIIHGWNMEWVGWLSGAPHLLRMIFAYFFSQFADSILHQNKMSRKNVRKLGACLCTVVSGCFVLAMAFSGCNAFIAALCVTLATTMTGSVTAGPFANIIDISPNYSGIILGVIGTVAVFPGFISPYIVGKLTLNNQTVQQWQYVFLIAAVCMIFCGAVYQIFGQAELQSWNQPKAKKDVEKCDPSKAKEKLNT